MSAPLRVLSLYEGFFAGGARILHTDVVRGLHTGGSQQHSILTIASRARRDAAVQPMLADPRYRALRASGVPVASLGKTAGTAPHAPTAFSSRQLRTAARAIAAVDVVLSLKEQPIGLLLALHDAMMLPDRPVVTCLHRSDPDHSGEAGDWLADAVERGIVTAAISCAHATDAAYAPILGGVTRAVVPNGVDTVRFRPAVTRGKNPLRAALGIPDGAPAVVLAARFDAMKDPALFFRAVAVHAAADQRAHYIVCGAGMSLENPNLRELIAGSGVDPSRVHALGIREDMPEVYRAADIVALTSAFGEASPLCLLEGAACGAVPVTTDVGDAARRIAGFGIVTGRDPREIAAAWSEVIGRREAWSRAVLAARPALGRNRMLAGYAAVIEGMRRTARRAA